VRQNTTIYHPITTTSPQKHHAKTLIFSQTPNKNALPPRQKKNKRPGKSQTA
jgi:hypothetical protein